MHKLHLPASFASNWVLISASSDALPVYYSGETQTNDIDLFDLIQPRPVKGSWPLETLQSIWKSSTDLVWINDWQNKLYTSGMKYFSAVPLSSGDILGSEDVVECVFMVQFKLHFLSRSRLLLSEEKAQQWLTLQCRNILKTTQSSSHDSFYYDIHICIFSWHCEKKKEKKGNNWCNYSFQCCKNSWFQQRKIPRTSNFFPTNSPVTLPKSHSNVISKPSMLIVYS